MEKGPKYFFDNHLMPNYRDWDDKPLDERCAMNAVLSAHHMADWVFQYWRQRDAKKIYETTKVHFYKDKISEYECPDFALVRDIADCHKHFAIGRRARQVSSVGAVSVGRFFPEPNPFFGNDEELIVTLEEGRRASLFVVMYNVVEMWTSLLRCWEPDINEH